MAGKAKTLKENEIVFKAGDAAASMYIVRKGALKVFFNKGAEEVTLAVLKNGAIVGEMAFFDNKPRSASVKAAEPTEVTEISKADFDNLLKQVPPWMVSMMQSLVGRLRQTNERLAEVEAQVAGSTGSPLILPNQKHPFQHIVRTLRVVLMVLAKEGTKEGNSMSVSADSCFLLWGELAGEDRELFDKIIESLEKTKLVQRKIEPKKPMALVFPSRGTLVHFTEFFSGFSRKLKPAQGFLSPDAVALLSALVEEAASSGYETLNISLNSFKAQPAAKELGISNWAAAGDELLSLSEIKVTKQASDLIFKIVVKEQRSLATYIRYIQMFKNQKLM